MHFTFCGWCANFVVVAREGGRLAISVYPLSFGCVCLAPSERRTPLLRCVRACTVVQPSPVPLPFLVGVAVEIITSVCPPRHDPDPQLQHETRKGADLLAMRRACGVRACTYGHCCSREPAL